MHGYLCNHRLWDDVVRALRAQGHAVLAINPRGSSGRGLDFAKAIYADWGRLDVADVLAVVDHLVKLGHRRIAIISGCTAFIFATEA